MTSITQGKVFRLSLIKYAYMFDFTKAPVRYKLSLHRIYL